MTTHEHSRNQRLHVLYIEDDEYQQEMYGAIIRRDSHHHIVSVTATAGDGLDYLKSHGVDCVLLDMNLPDMSGEQVLHEIRALHPQMPIISITADENESRAFSMMQAGADDYIIKQHYDHAYLMRSIRHAIERKRYVKENAELHQTLDKERVLHDMQKEFVSSVSHEIRTPLAIIGTSAQMIHRKLEPDVQKVVDKYIERIRHSVKRLEGIMDNSLKYSRIEEGETPFSPALFSLRELLAQLVEQFRELHSHERVIIVGDLLPDDYYGDRSLLEQVFTNLISNAIKYSSGDTNVTIYTVVFDDNIRIIVEDQGVGIAAEDLPQIGNKFFRAQTAKTMSGTGLGVYLSRSFLEMHKAVLDYASEEGRGTKAIVTLPRYLEREVGDPQEQRSA